MAEQYEAQQNAQYAKDATWSQLYAAVQTGQDLPAGDGVAAAGLSASSSTRLQSGFPADTGWGESTLRRTASAVRGPITDRRGLGTLAPYVLPGMLRRNSMSIGAQMSALQMFPSQRFPDDLLGQDGAARPFTAPMIQQQQQQLQPGKHPAQPKRSL